MIPAQGRAAFPGWIRPFPARRCVFLRRLRYGVAIGLLSAIAVPVGIILGFFGGAYREVDPDNSLFDWPHYYPMYLSVSGLVLLTGLVFVTLFWRERRELRKATGSVR